MRAVLLTMMATCALAQVDEDTLKEIFGTPPTGTGTTATTTTTTTTTTQRPVELDTFTVRPTDSPTTLKDKDGNPCKCVPYYLCEKGVGTHIRNASVTGWGELDIRFGEDKCQVTVEVCCTEPKEEEDVVTEPPPVEVKGCGYRNRKGLDFTISGGSGNEALFGEFPWVIALIDINGSYAGVGVLIHPQVVMTTAHVAYKYTPGNLKIRAGEWDTQTARERLKHQERIVTEMYIHNAFTKNNLFNDVALLRLESPVTLGQHINTICLPSQDEDFGQYKDCAANGWGKDSFGKEGRYAVILKKLEIPMVPHARCNELLRRTRLGNNFKLHKSFVCAGGEKGRDLCTGDGGAPLTCPIGGDRYKLTGLSAWGIGCGGQDIPAVYASAPAFRRWVDQKMQEWGYDTTAYSI
ncbi:hypothetical protein ABMA27_012862 [Loxostege sticticalis]|uniref:Peptidase S1 domain-containing protein n=1 Tax=Loxostege sticticalis TaxID=481309 RepID=A0ABR3H0T1_LOXSC